MIIAGFTNILGGTEILSIEDHRGDIWESTRQLPFVEEGKITPLGRLAELFMRSE